MLYAVLGQRDILFFSEKSNDGFLEVDANCISLYIDWVWHHHRMRFLLIWLLMPLKAMWSQPPHNRGKFSISAKVYHFRPFEKKLRLSRLLDSTCMYFYIYQLWFFSLRNLPTFRNCNIQFRDDTELSLRCQSLIFKLLFFVTPVNRQACGNKGTSINVPPHLICITWKPIVYLVSFQPHLPEFSVDDFPVVEKLKSL